MKLLIITLAVLAVSLTLKSCGPDRAVAADRDNMTCKYIGGAPIDFQRCENTEVICYAADGGLSCKWKEVTP